MSEMLSRAVAAGLKRGGSLEDQYSAALIAALDPEDEKLVEVVARSICLVGRDWDAPYDFDTAPDYAKEAQRDVARAAIMTLNRTAQGEQRDA